MTTPGGRETPYVVIDNSGSMVGGWRLCGPDGFWVYPDSQLSKAEEFCHAKNSAHNAAVQKYAALVEAARAVDAEFEKAIRIPNAPLTAIMGTRLMEMKQALSALGEGQD